MTTNALVKLEPDALTAKRAQYEAFRFELKAPGLLRVANGSSGDNEKADQSYRVNVENGVPAACEFPADTYRDGACKHRVAVAIGKPVLEAATTGDSRDRVATDGGELVVAGDEGEVLEESDDDGRPEDCGCAEFLADAGPPCWPCYREGFREPVSAAK